MANSNRGSSIVQSVRKPHPGLPMLPHEVPYGRRKRRAICRAMSSLRGAALMGDAFTTVPWVAAASQRLASAMGRSHAACPPSGARL